LEVLICVVLSNSFHSDGEMTYIGYVSVSYNRWKTTKCTIRSCKTGLNKTSSYLEPK